MTIKTENNIAKLEHSVSNYKVEFIITRLDGKEISNRNAEIILTSAMKLVTQKIGELTD
jgi:hypothetical protein